MVKFNQDEIGMFLGVVRKYMQLRGGLSQKDLAVGIKVGISTMSRFINQKTKEYDAQMIASIIAYLNIPLHEVIEFIAEESTQTFKKLVSFYKDNIKADEENSSHVDTGPDLGGLESGLEGLDQTQTRKKTTATIKGVKMTFGERSGPQDNDNLSIRDKLNQLSPRQKGFLTDFLNLDVEGRDLIVDIGNQLFSYFKQGQADF